MASSYLLWWRASVSCRHDFVNDKPARAEVNRLIRAFDNSCVFPNTVLTKFAKRVEAAAGGVTSSLLVFRDVIAGVAEEKLAAHEARIQESIIAKVAASETQVNEASAWVIAFTVASAPQLGAVQLTTAATTAPHADPSLDTAAQFATAAPLTTEPPTDAMTPVDEATPPTTAALLATAHPTDAPSVVKAAPLNAAAACHPTAALPQHLIYMHRRSIRVAEK